MSTNSAPTQGGRHLLVRDGESAANAGLATADPAAIPLTSAGHSQAARFALDYDGPDPALIVVSPFTRARETAAPFIRRFPEARVEGWPVHEFTYLSSVRCGHSTPESRRPMVEAYWAGATPDHVDGPGAESFLSFLRRVERCLDRLSDRPEPTVVFTHEMVMKTALWIARGASERTPQAFRDFIS